MAVEGPLFADEVGVKDTIVAVLQTVWRLWPNIDGSPVVVQGERLEVVLPVLCLRGRATRIGYVISSMPIPVADKTA